MQIKNLNLIGLMIFYIYSFFSCHSNTGEMTETQINTKAVSMEDTITPILKSDEEWRKVLTKEQYEVIRNHGTEKAFTGELLNIKEQGVYKCAACGLELFSSETKFESGTGWPSFYDRVNRYHVEKEPDDSYGMRRTEVHCGRCKGHLGHVFTDGPDPTGLRYCINSVSLEFEKKSDR